MVDEDLLLTEKECKDIFDKWGKLDAAKRYDITVFFSMLNKAQLTKDEIRFDRERTEWQKKWGH